MILASRYSTIKVLLFLLTIPFDNLMSQDFFIYNENDGLLNSTVQGIVEDNFGNVWVCQENSGLFKFDGGSWTQFEVSDGHSFKDDIRFSLMIIDDEETLWLTTKDIGFIKISLREDISNPQNWKNYNIANTDSLLLDNFVRSIAFDDSGRIWIGGANKGLNIIDPQPTDEQDPLLNPDNWTSISDIGPQLSSRRIKYLASDSENRVWVGTGNGIARFDGGDLPGGQWFQGLLGSSITYMYLDAFRNLWIGRNSNTLVVVNLDQPDHFLELSPGSDTFSISAITQDKDSNLWLASTAEAANGIKIFDPRAPFSDYNQNDFHFDELMGLPSNQIGILATLGEGDLWIGAPNGSVTRYDGSWVSFTNSKSKIRRIKDISSFVEDNAGNLWLGVNAENYGGLRKANLDSTLWFLDSWEVISVDNGLPSNEVNTIYQDDTGLLWIGLNVDSPNLEKIVLLDPETSSLQLLAGSRTGGNFIYDIVQGPDLFIWIGTNAGLIRVAQDSLQFPNAWQLYDLGGGLSGNTINSLTIDMQNVLWIGTDNNLHRIDLTNFSVQNLEAISLFGGKRILKTYQDLDRNIWVCTAAFGAFMINYESDPMIGANWQNINTEDGLVSNRVNDMLHIDATNYWFATNAGVSHLRLNVLEGHKEELWTTYSTDFGPGRIPINTIFLDSKGDLWFGTNNSGAIKHRIKTEPPRTRIDTQIDITSADPVIFRYSGIDFSTPEGLLRFSYKIDDQAWTPFLPTTVVPIFGLTAGRHTFQVRTLDIEGNVDMTPAREDFYKLEPALGGSFTVTDGPKSIRLYIPAGELDPESNIHILLNEATEFLDSLNITCFTLNPSDLVFNKSGNLKLAVHDPLKELETTMISISRLIEKGNWFSIGGTPVRQNDSLIISVPITKGGQYALRKQLAGNPERAMKITDIQPRVIHPRTPSKGFGGLANILFSLNKSSEINIKIFDIAGRLVNHLVDSQVFAGGLNSVSWNGCKNNGEVCRSGLYFVVISSNGATDKKTVLISNKFR